MKGKKVAFSAKLCESRCWLAAVNVMEVRGDRKGMEERREECKSEEVREGEGKVSVLELSPEDPRGCDPRIGKGLISRCVLVPVCV